MARDVTKDVVVNPGNIKPQLKEDEMSDVKDVNLNSPVYANETEQSNLQPKEDEMSEQATHKSRYWVSAGIWDPSDTDYPYNLEEDDPQGREIYENDLRISNYLEELGFINTMNGYVFKTWDKKETFEAARKAYIKIWDGGIGVPDVVSVSTQPICPQCGNLARFSDSHCSNCGSELVDGDQGVWEYKEEEGY